VAKSYRRRAVLHDVDLRVHPGEAVAVVGENGAGKTTLLRNCAGLLPAGAGQVATGGRVGYCPQEPGLMDLLTADEHPVLFGRAAGLTRSAARRRGRAVLAEVGFPPEHHTVARELSGGARQKLNLALALLAEPDILLLDEPYQGLDRGSYLNFWTHVAAWRHAGHAIVIVTHLLAELDRVDRVVELPAHTPHWRG
jgi:ABC-type multidrug transport system ATPase subunit